MTLKPRMQRGFFIRLAAQRELLSKLLSAELTAKPSVALSL